ncbi:MAG: amidohydrolase family protein [Thermoleophilia bacterium]|nr:amidohydrolase family protein [Thermoleophilia bacterium]
MAAVLSGCRHDEPQRGDLLLRADRLFDGERVVEPGAVLIRGDDIVAAGAELDAEADRVLELGDATILPGLIDLHVHLGSSHPRARERFAESGVTTVRSVGDPLATLSPSDEDAPLRLVQAGPILTAPDGYPIPVWGDAHALAVRGEARARAAVRDLVHRGAAVVKIALEPAADWPLLSPGEVRAIVDEAHAHDRPVTAHATGTYAVELALDAGVDELAHAPCGVADELLERLVERGVEVVGTLHVLAELPDDCPDPVPDAARFVALGGRLLYGTDVPAVRVWGIDVEELRLLRRAGLDPEDVLAAATSHAGEQLGRAPLGTLAEGAPADVIAVRGDARELGDDLAKPVLVVRAGRVLVDPAGR